MDRHYLHSNQSIFSLNLIYSHMSPIPRIINKVACQEYVLALICRMDLQIHMLLGHILLVKRSMIRDYMKTLDRLATLLLIIQHKCFHTYYMQSKVIQCWWIGSQMLYFKTHWDRTSRWLFQPWLACSPVLHNLIRIFRIYYKTCWVSVWLSFSWCHYGVLLLK